MFLSSGPNPAFVGSILRFTPSRPGMGIAAKARYGLEVAPGQRNSMRLLDAAAGPVKYIGMRPAALRLRLLNAMFTGASKCGTSRRYEFVVHAQSASSALTCVR